MLGLATTRQVKGERVLTDYQHDVMYDYVDEVEVSVNEYTDESIESVYTQMEQDKKAIILSIMSVAMLNKIKPTQLASILSTEKMPLVLEYMDKVNDEMEKLKAQKTKAVKTK